MISKKVVRAMSFLMAFVFLSVFLTQAVVFAAGEDLNAKLTQTKDSIYGLLKNVAKIVAVIAVAIAGFILLFKSGEPDAMRWLKGTAVVFLIAVGVLFLAQPITDAVFSFFE
ncbi:TrbC/VirB2 family protein [Thermicanus aegyptius]|uniref:TrbC/VirB2 family protein n=1 Tax=Thermicanus aegyptius TaxID=94009 RepID=UPI00040326C5|nr:TrbC/VirB2 family protein [Thermicanus aegyptius]